MNHIPFNKPHHAEREAEYLSQALASDHWAGDGPFTAQASAMLSPMLGGGDVLLTTSCTHALEMAALLLELGPGDEVILPAFTFVSCANAIALRGATPVFVDSRSDTFNIDERLIPAAITDKTRAILVVHYAGFAAEMDTIMALAAKHDLAVIEDNAHGLGGQYHGRALGSFGTFATQSFHNTKNISCGEGGALVINDPKYLPRAEIIREKGTNRSQFFRGMVDKYRWVDVGSSYLPSDILAALLVSQLEVFDTIQNRRMRVWDRYRTELSQWAADNGVKMQSIPDGIQHPAHIFALVMASHADQIAFLEHLNKHGVGAVFHYQPLDQGPVGRVSSSDTTTTDMLADCLIRLPLFADLADSEVDHVITTAISFSIGREG